MEHYVNKILPMFRFGQVRKCTKMIARPTLRSITRATKMGLGPCGNTRHKHILGWIPLGYQQEAAQNCKIHPFITACFYCCSKYQYSERELIRVESFHHQKCSQKGLLTLFKYWGESRNYTWHMHLAGDVIRLTVSSSLISDTISMLAFLVSARLFGLLDSSLFSLEGSDGLMLFFGGTGEGLEFGRDFSGAARFSFAGGDERTRLDGWKSSSTLSGSSGGGTLTSALT